MTDDAQRIADLSSATIETKERKYRDVAVEIYPGWVKIDDRGEETWVPRERVLDGTS